MPSAYRAEVIGSLLRPAYLKEARARHAAVTTKHAALEDRAALARRIRGAAAFVPLERLALSPQCGFASTEEGNLLTPADQEAKLVLVSETAREVWGGS